MLRRLPPLLRSLGAGLLICFALPPWGWWPLAPVGVAPWLAELGGRSPSRRFAVGYAVAVGWFGLSTLWMWRLTAPGYVLAVTVFWGLMVGAVSALCPSDRRRLIVLPALIVAFEWFHWHAPFGGVPLSVLALTQGRGPLLPAARVGGALLVGGLVAAAGAALYVGLWERRWRVALAVAVGIAVVATAGVAVPLGAPVATERVAAIQGGGPQGTRFAQSDVAGTFRRSLEATRRVQPPVDLVLWPEDTINIDGKFADNVWKSEIAAEAARLDAPIVVGVVESVGPDRFTNYAVVVRPDGTLGDRYDKERRVPFGEYVPFRNLLEPLVGGGLPPRDQIPGTGTATLRTSAGPLAVAISWEVFFGRRVREGVRGGGEIVVNPTNGASYWLTQVQSQQIATSALRAVESGRWLVQAAPTGFTAFIGPDGRVRQRTAVSEPAVLYQRVERLDATTPAQALGDAPALAVALLSLAGVAVWSIRRKRQPSEPATTTESTAHSEPPDSEAGTPPTSG
ncbi:MAG: apolipoprotein N-acyltransferase [Actinomycetes bacterium]